MDNQEQGDGQWETPSPDSFSSQAHAAAGMALAITGLVGMILGIALLTGVITIGRLIGTVFAIIVGGVLGLATVFIPHWISLE